MGGGNETFCCPRFLSLPRPLMAERSAGAAGRWSGRGTQRGVRAAGGCAGSAVRCRAGCAGLCALCAGGAEGSVLVCAWPRF